MADILTDDEINHLEIGFGSDDYCRDYRCQITELTTHGIAANAEIAAWKEAFNSVIGDVGDANLTPDNLRTYLRNEDDTIDRLQAIVAKQEAALSEIRSARIINLEAKLEALEAKVTAMTPVCELAALREGRFTRGVPITRLCEKEDAR